MRKFTFALIATAFAMPAFADDAPATQTAAAPAKTPEQVIEEFRNDLQTARADIMAKGMTLTADQAAKFWPMYDQFQKEQNAIIDEQGKAVVAFAEGYDTLTDANSVAFIDAQLKRDQRMHDLRVKYLAKFQTILPGGLAARAIQIDRRVGTVGQVMLSSQLPLVH
jgi:Spy/CpxP family protein refolding chaperone